MNVLVTTFKETVLQECAQMIRSNETDSKLSYFLIFPLTCMGESFLDYS